MWCLKQHHFIIFHVFVDQEFGQDTAGWLFHYTQCQQRIHLGTWTEDSFTLTSNICTGIARRLGSACSIRRGNQTSYAAAQGSHGECLKRFNPKLQRFIWSSFWNSRMSPPPLFFLPSKSLRPAQIQKIGNEIPLLNGRRNKEFAATFCLLHHINQQSTQLVLTFQRMHTTIPRTERKHCNVYLFYLKNKLNFTLFNV